MFAILISDVMDPFYKNITTFPTVIFTFLIALCLIYWLGAVLGMVDLDIFGVEMPDGDADFGGDDGLESAGLLAGLFLKFKLTGVPFPIVFSILCMIGWIICYYAVYFIFPFVPGRLLEIIVGVPILICTFYFSALITGRIINPLRPLFKEMEQNVQKKIIGKVAVVRTSRVDGSFGEAKVEDGGAGLIVKVRSFKEEAFERGDRVVLLEYIKEENIYKVISEKEFSNT